MVVERRSRPQSALDQILDLMQMEHAPGTPASIVAGEYINKGREGIQLISSQLSKAGQKITSQEDFIDAINSTQRETAVVSLAGILMGISIYTIEDVLINKESSLSDWIGAYNMAIADTIMDNAAPIEKRNEVVTNHQWKRMIDYARDDPTLGIFFSEKFEALPQHLQSTLEKSAYMKIINTRVLPSYREQTSELIQLRTSKSNK